MIPIPAISPLRSYIYAGLAVLFALMVANTYRLSSAVDRAEADLVQCGADRDRLQSAIEEQNKAVEEMRKTAIDARERADKALKEALAEERTRADISARLAAFQRRAGESECDASRRLIQEYRK